MPPNNMTKARFFFKAENGETWEEIKELTDAEVTSLKEELEEREEYARVVRCRDCKHYRIHTLFGRSQGWCERLCDQFDRSMARGTNEDDFCSRAERKE